MRLLATTTTTPSRHYAASPTTVAPPEFDEAIIPSTASAPPRPRRTQERDWHSSDRARVEARLRARDNQRRARPNSDRPFGISARTPTVPPSPRGSCQCPTGLPFTRPPPNSPRRSPPSDSTCSHGPAAPKTPGSCPEARECRDDGGRGNSDNIPMTTKPRRAQPTAAASSPKEKSKQSTLQKSPSAAQHCGLPVSDS